MRHGQTQEQDWAVYYVCPAPRSYQGATVPRRKQATSLRGDIALENRRWEFGAMSVTTRIDGRAQPTEKATWQTPECINEDGRCHFRAGLQRGVRNGQKRLSLEDHGRKGIYWCCLLGSPGPPPSGRPVLARRGPSHGDGRLSSACRTRPRAVRGESQGRTVKQSHAPNAPKNAPDSSASVVSWAGSAGQEARGGVGLCHRAGFGRGSEASRSGRTAPVCLACHSPPIGSPPTPDLPLALAE